MFQYIVEWAKQQKMGMFHRLEGAGSCDTEHDGHRTEQDVHQPTDVPRNCCDR